MSRAGCAAKNHRVTPNSAVTPPPDTLRQIDQVEMSQWQEQTRSETRNKLCGGAEAVTTYNYRRVWQEGRNDSNRFLQPKGRQK